MDIDPDTKSPVKSPVVRGARACTVCRAAKMKCVGAEDGQKQCQRCKRANVDCIFEKHRRGRKPGSKLSEASKMLRRLEKGLNSAKLKSQSTESALPSPYQVPEQRTPLPPQEAYPALRPSEPTYSSTSTHFPTNELPPLNIPTYQDADAYPPSSNGSRTMDMDDDDDDADKNESFFPAKLIKRENQRNSFFRTILNPEETPSSAAPVQRGNSFTPPHPRLAPTPPGLSDPIAAGIVSEDQAKILFDLIFLRLNPFINLFDPALHTVPYVRSKCPFLLTTLLMAGSKFFRPEFFKQCQKLANEFAVRAFAEAWKRVEVVQAFACLTYWKEPDDSRTWTYIGYACRMAVELGLNRYVAHPPANETDTQKLERRNRERTYLILFVHDRSLSTQTGRHWMLPEGDLVKHSTTWHLGGIKVVRPEDVIIAAFVQLRLIAAETTDIFSTSKGAATGGSNDINYEVVLRNCNAKLTQWDDTWRAEMLNAKGESFHMSFLSIFRLYVRLFLNSFGIQASLVPGSRQTPSLQALTTCCTSALDSLRIVSRDFVKLSMLSYGQDSITVMTAYSAVFLLKLLRTPSTYSQMGEASANEIYNMISHTADSYFEASNLSPAATSAAYHARFLHSLLANDIFRSRRNERERNETGMPIDPRLQGQSASHGSMQSSPSQVYPHQASRVQEQSFQFPASPHLPAHPQTIIHQSGYHSDLSRSHASSSNSATMHYYNPGNLPAASHHASELDAHYWKNMFIELGFGENSESQTNVLTVGTSDTRSAPQYLDNNHPSHASQPSSQHQHQHQQYHAIQHQSQLPYHDIQSSTHPHSHPPYGH